MTATLYTYERPARQVATEDISHLALDDRKLLWVHVVDGNAERMRLLIEALRLPPSLLALLTSTDATPEFRDVGDAFGIRTQSPEFDERLRFRTHPLRIAGSANVVLSAVDAPLGFVDALHASHDENSALGVLGAESFTVALLDGLLGTYYDAMSRLEHDVEQLEIRILSARQGDCLDQLRGLRKASSQLRRMLWSHRTVFGGLSRPDFRPDQSRKVDEQFAALEARYERAMDRVEHGRDLVVGTFELFTTRAAMQTNRTMQVLTFVTVLIGGLAVLAGVLGMNFEAPFFKTGELGFWSALCGMLAFSFGATWLARRKGWV